MAIHHRLTGPGRISINKPAPMGGVWAVMSNYDIDVDQPKAEHLTFLLGRVLPLVLGKKARIWLQGSASSTGTEAHNMGLSRRRADNIAAYLKSRGIPASQIQVDAVGESLASTKIPENATDRAVPVLIAHLFDQPPAPRPAPPAPAPGPQLTKSFRLRMIFGFSGGADWDIDRFYFQIVDRAHKMSCIYSYLGLGLGVSLRPIAPTLKGPWNDFFTTGEMASTEFDGAARFTSAGGGAWSINYFNMMGLPRHIATMPNLLKIDTGITVGLGLSSTIGRLTLRTTGPFTE